MFRVKSVVVLLSVVILAADGSPSSFVFPGQTRFARQDFVFPDQSGFGGWQSPWIQQTQKPPKLNQRVSNRPGQTQGPFVNRVDDERISQRSKLVKQSDFNSHLKLLFLVFRVQRVRKAQREEDSVRDAVARFLDD